VGLFLYFAFCVWRFALRHLYLIAFRKHLKRSQLASACRLCRKGNDSIVTGPKLSADTNRDLVFSTRNEIRWAILFWFKICAACNKPRALRCIFPSEFGAQSYSFLQVACGLDNSSNSFGHVIGVASTRGSRTTHTDEENMPRQTSTHIDKNRA
jgi:hypothetical protein